MAESGRTRRRRPGTTGVLVIVALVAIAGAWLVTTFSTSIASAAQGTQERVALMFMSDEERIEEAVQEFVKSQNYTGSDGEQWRQQLESSIVPEEYYSSVAGEEFQRLTKISGNDTFRWSTEIENWKLESKTDRSATGTLAVQGAWDWTTIDGKPTDVNYETNVRLAKTDEGWKVASEEYAEEEQSESSGG